MTDFFDAREARDPAAREADLFAKLAGVMAAAKRAPAFGQLLAGVEAPADRAGLAKLPVTRKSELPQKQKDDPPFGGFVPGAASSFGRLFTSPGPIYEGEGTGPDPWRGGRALHAAGFRAGMIALNTFSYHMTPGGFILDSAARAVGCAVIPAGPGQTDAQLDLIEHYKPDGYCGTPDFLKILLDAASEKGRDVSSMRLAQVSGAAFPPSLQAEIKSRGVDAYQTYATADCGVIAYETPAREGMVVNEDVIVEIVRPGTGEPLADGEIGEVLVTSLDAHHPLIRFSVGDMSAVMPGASPCGRTNMRIVGWRGRADQTAKIKGMFVRPEQVAALAARFPALGRMRLVVTREGEQDAMTLRAEAAAAEPGLSEALGAALQDGTRLRGRVELVPPGSLPADGKVIADERPVG